MTKYRKKPVVIDAIQWDGEQGKFAEIQTAFECDWDTMYQTPSALYIETLEGTIVASKGDWIIKGVKGEVYPCKPDIFAMTYEAVEDD